ncbi:hypothetical protein BJY24_001300 [Nocardia transvalensis]|uniref:Low molecular weight antigen MTB12-like C-terminal domain-containing protein n=1 Tax=Nocardia transvalensis TaxID=37333 RepID=A0A7W9PB05_9NOCA|nr:hypothetical protein [Nocardia transvalensis]MBB5912433.1 hypothetical protein [Nocardia transvalensis]
MFNRDMFTRTAATIFAASALVLSAAACGGSDNQSDTASTTGPPSVTQAVTDSYERFFDGGTGADQKMALLENGKAFADTIKAQADSPIAKATSAEVSGVASTGTDHADVTYTILMGGKPALANQQGSAIRQDGTWKVTAATFCALLTLQGNPPPVCATPTN